MDVNAESDSEAERRKRAKAEEADRVAIKTRKKRDYAQVVQEKCWKEWAAANAAKQEAMQKTAELEAVELARMQAIEVSYQIISDYIRN